MADVGAAAQVRVKCGESVGQMENYKEQPELGHDVNRKLSCGCLSMSDSTSMRC